MQHEGRGEERNGEEQGTSYLEPIVFFLILPEGILTSQQPFNGGMGEDGSDRERKGERPLFRARELGDLFRF